MILAKDFIDFVSLLNKHRVEYMVVGGYALGFHGEPRTTGDMDIWINCTARNAAGLVRVVNDFGMSALGLQEQDFLEPGIVTQIGYPPLRIDILNEIDGVKYKDAVKGKQYFKEGKLEIPFIGRNDFIKNKEAVGRKKDVLDAKKLKTAARGQKAAGKNIKKRKPG